MTKKYYIALADALRAEKPPEFNSKGSNVAYNVWSNKRIQWYADVIAIANTCARLGSNFNRDRWLAYVNGECGPNGGAVKK